MAGYCVLQLLYPWQYGLEDSHRGQLYQLEEWIDGLILVLVHHPATVARAPELTVFSFLDSPI